jgi:hypothetical protein
MLWQHFLGNALLIFNLNGAMTKKLFLMILVLAISACAEILPKEHLIPKEQLVGTLQKHFPIHQQKGPFSITIDEPQLNLGSNQNRLGINGHFSARAAMLGVEGNLTISSKLKYNSAQRAIFLQEVSLDSLSLKHGNNIPEILRAEINHMMNDYAANNPVYVFKPDELKILGVELEVEDIAIVPEGIVLKLRGRHA